MPRIANASLILTVLNEATALPAFFESVQAQTVLPADIVVVDGGSVDGTARMFAEWELPSGVEVTVVVSNGANISKGRNIAFSSAKHERVLVTDAGTSLSPKWAEQMLEGFERVGSPAVICGFFEPVGEALTERTIAFTVTPRVEEIDGQTFLPSSRSLATTRQAWQDAGGYPEWLDYCEDLLFDLELKRLGKQFEFVPEARVTWSARPTLAAFMKQYFRYARGDGKASLWAKRHVARYAAYAVGLVVLGFCFVQPLLLILLAAGGFLYLRKFWRRLWRGREEFGSGFAAGIALVPVVVVAGDLAKMAGYPAGLLWKRKHRASAHQ